MNRISFSLVACSFIFVFEAAKASDSDQDMFGILDALDEEFGTPAPSPLVARIGTDHNDAQALLDRVTERLSPRQEDSALSDVEEDDSGQDEDTSPRAIYGFRIKPYATSLPTVDGLGASLEEGLGISLGKSLEPFSVSPGALLGASFGRHSSPHPSQIMSPVRLDERPSSTSPEYKSTSQPRFVIYKHETNGDTFRPDAITKLQDDVKQGRLRSLSGKNPEMYGQSPSQASSAPGGEPHATSLASSASASHSPALGSSPL